MYVYAVWHDKRILKVVKFLLYWRRSSVEGLAYWKPAFIFLYGVDYVCPHCPKPPVMPHINLLCFFFLCYLLSCHLCCCIQFTHSSTDFLGPFKVAERRSGTAVHTQMKCCQASSLWGCHYHRDLALEGSLCMRGCLSTAGRDLQVLLSCLTPPLG